MKLYSIVTKYGVQHRTSKCFVMELAIDETYKRREESKLTNMAWETHYNIHAEPQLPLQQRPHFLLQTSDIVQPKCAANNILLLQQQRLQSTDNTDIVRDVMTDK